MRLNPAKYLIRLGTWHPRMEMEMMAAECIGSKAQNVS